MPSTYVSVPPSATPTSTTGPAGSSTTSQTPGQQPSMQPQASSVKEEMTVAGAKKALDELKGKGRQLISDDKKATADQTKAQELSQQIAKIREELLKLTAGGGGGISKIADSIMHMYKVAGKLCLLIDAKLANGIWGKMWRWAAEHPALQKPASPEELASGVDCKIDDEGVLTTEFSLQNKKLDNDHQKFYETLLHGFLQNEGYAIKVENGKNIVVDPANVDANNDPLPIDEEKFLEVMGDKNENFAKFCENLAENTSALSLRR